MFALIEAVRQEKSALKDRFRRRFSGYRGVSVRAESILSLPIFRIVMEDAPPESRQAGNRIAETIEILLRRNIRRLCFHEGFRHREKFLNAGFSELDDSFLKKLMAGEIAAKAAKDDKSAAALYARRFSTLETKALFDLCGNFRYVIAESERGGKEVFARIASELGVAPVEKLTEPVLRTAGAAVLFAAPERRLVFPERCAVLALEPGILSSISCSEYISKVDFTFSGALIESIPEGYPPEAIVSEAASFGLVRNDRIMVRNVEVSRESQRPGT